ncbi:MAG: hypothetical protein AAF353_07165, partial [Pseudomonadota bacterium]
MTSLKPVSHVSAWRSSEQGREHFCVYLNENHLSAIDQALKKVRAETADAEAITRELFDLSEIQSDVDAWREQVMDNEGIIILCGFPLERYSKDELGMIHFGLGTHFGEAMSQSVIGDRLGHVVNVG